MSQIVSSSNSTAKNLVIAGETWGALKEQVGILLKSGFLPPTVNTIEKALAIVLQGLELRIPMMQALKQIAVIQQKTAIGAELQLALIFRDVPTAIIDIDSKDDCCRITAQRSAKHPKQHFKFDMEDAAKAKLLGKENWQKYPRAMLRSRCISEMARAVFPDAIAGMSHTPEELGATVNEEGDIIDIEVTEKTKNEPSQTSSPAPSSESAPPPPPPPPPAQLYDPKIPQLVAKLKLAVASKYSITALKDFEQISGAMAGRPAADLDSIVKDFFENGPKQ